MFARTVSRLAPATLRRAQSTLAATRATPRFAPAAMAGAGALAAAYFVSQDEAHSETVMGALNTISTRLTTIEDALGINFEADLAKIRKIKVDFPDNLGIKHFDEAYFNSLDTKGKKAMLAIARSGIENADSGMGCYAMNPSDYDDYKPYLGKAVSEYHKVPMGQKHVTNWDLKGVEGLPASGILDVTDLGLPPLSMRVRVGRNLADFPLPGAMTKQDRIDMENKLSKAFEKLKAKYGGRYYSLTPGNPDFINDDEYKALVKARFMFKDMAVDTYLATAGIASDWPFGRGCYVSEDQGFIIWVGEEDHMRIMCMNKSGKVINDVFDRLKSSLDTVESIDGLSFKHSEEFGYVTSCPTNLGTGMRASVLMKIPKLTAGGSDANAKAVCKPLGLGVRGMGGEHTAIGADGTCDISPTARFCISEAEIVTALYIGVRNLKAKEDAL
jgi:creatine kinase